jgi:hypothetical protein
MNNFFMFFLSGLTVANFVLQTTPEEKMARINTGKSCCPNTSAPKDTGQSLHRCVYSVGGKQVLLKPQTEPFFFCNYGKNCLRMTQTHLP